MSCGPLQCAFVCLVLSLPAAAQDGFRPVIGGLPFDSGFALGVEYRKSRLAGDAFDFRAKAVGSVKKYEFLETELALPRLAKGLLFAEVRARYRNYPEEDFWGLGHKSRKDLRSTYRLEDMDYTGVFGVRPKRGLEAGVAGGILNVNTGPGKDKDRPSIEELFSREEAPALDRQPDYLHLGVFLRFDTREESPSPRRGGWREFRWTRFRDRGSGRYDFHRYEIDLRQFFPAFGDTDAVAVRGLATLSTKGAGREVPFFLQPTVGGGSDLRGYHQYRFRDENALVFNLEYRWPWHEMFHAVVFADAARVYRRPGEIGLGGLRGSIGLGGRLKLGEGFLLGLDLGWSPGGPRLWFRGAHMF